MAKTKPERVAGSGVEQAASIAAVLNLIAQIQVIAQAQPLLRDEVIGELTNCINRLSTIKLRRGK